jgi:hypothetical protein
MILSLWSFDPIKSKIFGDLSSQFCGWEDYGKTRESFKSVFGAARSDPQENEQGGAGVGVGS